MIRRILSLKGRARQVIPRFDLNVNELGDSKVSELREEQIRILIGQAETEGGLDSISHRRLSRLIAAQDLGDF